MFEASIWVKSMYMIENQKKKRKYGNQKIFLHKSSFKKTVHKWNLQLAKAS